MTDINRISFMFSVENRARADVMLSSDRTYYRFATEDSMEEGELPGNPEHFDEFARELLDVFRAGVGVNASTDPVHFTLFVNNTRVTPEVLNNDTLRRFICRMARYADEFAFLRGFE